MYFMQHHFTFHFYRRVFTAHDIWRRRCFFFFLLILFTCNMKLFHYLFVCMCACFFFLFLLIFCWIFFFFIAFVFDHKLSLPFVIYVRSYCCCCCRLCFSVVSLLYIFVYPSGDYGIGKMNNAWFIYYERVKWETEEEKKKLYIYI